METTHIVTMKVKRSGGQMTFYHFEASYNAGQAKGEIVFSFMKTADTLEESDLNLFLFPETDRFTIYQYGDTLNGRITKIGQVDGDSYCGVLDNGGSVEFNIESVTSVNEEDYIDEEEEEEDTPVAPMKGKHLRFRNVPLDGTLDEFCSKLSGYSLVEESDDTRTLSGRYAGRDAEIYVYANPDTGMVYKVMVSLAAWTECEKIGACKVIHKDFDEVSEAFKKKYGEEYAVERNDYFFYEDEYSAEDPDFELGFMQDVNDSDAEVSTSFTFETDESEYYSYILIFVSYDPDEDDEDSWIGYVNISFVDGENQPFEEEEEEDVEIDIDEL